MKNLVLIGMPSAGKSTLGVLLAKALGMPFVDTDLIIQEREQMLLQDIINSLGNKKFREVEEQAIINHSFNRAVIATGGSVVYSEKAMEHLKKDGLIIYLKLPYEEIEKRLENIKTRGITMDKDQTLKSLYEERIPLYERYADIIIDCFGKDIERNIEEITEKLKYNK